MRTLVCIPRYTCMHLIDMSVALVAQEVEDEDGWDEDSDDETDPVQKKAKVEASNSEAVAPVQQADKETPFQTPHKSSGGSDQSTATPSASPTTAASTTTSRSSSILAKCNACVV